MKASTAGIYFIDLDLRGQGRIFVRSVPVRTHLFFTRYYSKLDYWMREQWYLEIRKRLGVRENVGVILLLKKRKILNAVDFHIDKYWDNILSELVHRALQLEAEMWRLSTLGGAFSAIGFFDEQFVRCALRVSMRQLEIAKMFDDPILIARCHLYISLGLAQKRHFHIAGKIVREIWRQGKMANSRLLKNCALGIWSTIKWMRGGGRMVAIDY